MTTGIGQARAYCTACKHSHAVRKDGCFRTIAGCPNSEKPATGNDFFEQHLRGEIHPDVEEVWCQSGRVLYLLPEEITMLGTPDRCACSHLRVLHWRFECPLCPADMERSCDD